jgi:hypothetical protein
MAYMPACFSPPAQRSLADERNRIIILVAGVSWAAAFVHGAVTSAHFAEYWLFGVFFVVVAMLQFGWGAWIYQDPRPERLWLGAIGNLLVLLVWTLSRTVGLPLGPGAWHPEAIGFADMMATLDEVGIAVMGIGLLVRPRLLDGIAKRQLWESLALTLMVLSLLGAMTGAHHH